MRLPRKNKILVRAQRTIRFYSDYKMLKKKGHLDHRPPTSGLNQGSTDRQLTADEDVTLSKDPFLRPPLCFFLILLLTSLCLLLLINLYFEFENDIIEYQFTSLVSFLTLCNRKGINISSISGNLLRGVSV